MLGHVTHAYQMKLLNVKYFCNLTDAFGDHLYWVNKILISLEFFYKPESSNLQTLVCLSRQKVDGT